MLPRAFALTPRLGLSVNFALNFGPNFAYLDTCPRHGAPVASATARLCVPRDDVSFNLTLVTITPKYTKICSDSSSFSNC